MKKNNKHCRAKQLFFMVSSEDRQILDNMCLVGFFRLLLILASSGTFTCVSAVGPIPLFQEVLTPVSTPFPLSPLNLLLMNDFTAVFVFLSAT